jgi:hypothetical protein
VFPRLQPKASRSLPSWTETQVSVTPSYLASGVYASAKPELAPREEDHGAPLGQELRESGINGPLPTSWVPSIYSVSPLRALDRPAWFAVVAGFNTGPLPKKIMGHEFFLSADLSKTRFCNHIYLITNMFHVEQ